MREEIKKKRKMHVRSENLQIKENCSIVCEAPVLRLLVSKESATFCA